MNFTDTNLSNYIEKNETILFNQIIEASLSYAERNWRCLISNKKFIMLNDCSIRVVFLNKIKTISLCNQGSEKICLKLDDYGVIMEKNQKDVALQILKIISTQIG